jgi:DNA-binding Lrp family transcriptional regulator
MDDVDERILQVLNDDARRPSEDIAAELGISAGEVDDRIHRLREEGVITKFTAMFDPSKLGYVSVAFGFSVEPGEADRIARQLSELENIYKLWILSGRHNIIAHANFTDITEFQEFSHETLHRMDGINNYETSIATKSILNEGSVVLSHGPERD